MLIDKELSKYIVFSEDSVINALKKISDNKSRIIFLVTEYGVLEGVLTDGDLRRWLVNQKTIELNQPVTHLSNKNFTYAFYEDSHDKISSLFSERIEYVPLLDSHHHLVAVARKRTDKLTIGEFTIDAESPVFIIAEIGNNHNGSLELAKKLIDEAVIARADCAKFQMRSLTALYHNAGNANDAGEDLGSQYTLDLLSRFQLKPEEMLAAFDYCKKRRILPLCTPWDQESLAILENYGMPAYKIASADITNHDFLKVLAATGKPLICSTGMSTEAEVIESVHLLQGSGAMYVLLHCNSTYPAPFKDVNIKYIDRLKEIGDCQVGYSGHERGINVALAAVARGAKVIEKHFTLDKTLEGNDHKVSLLPEEFKAMIEGIRQIEETLGSAAERRLSQGELINRETLAKSLVINCDLQAGEIITEEMIDIKSPGRGLQPNHKTELVGIPAKRAFKAGDFFFPSDVAKTRVQARYYSFKRPWGVPVRYHDFTTILAKSNPDFLEFHLSYKDLEQDIHQYFDRKYDLALIVHSPELFSGDHILDLCTKDKSYRQRSIRELQRVIDLTRMLKPFFKKASKPCIVTNVGGFTSDVALPAAKRAELYALLLDSLAILDMTGIEIIPQTMPPFPWHFGGQSYHNLFVEPGDIANFCAMHNYRICLDVSHSKLACNHHKQSFKQFIDQVGPYVAHLHIADAKGLDGEGLQIDEGEIDFPALAEHLAKIAPQISFIPEIWQGHKNDGEGFWVALEKLEKFF